MHARTCSVQGGSGHRADPPAAAPTQVAAPWCWGAGGTHRNPAA